MTGNRNANAKLNGMMSFAYQLILLTCGFLVPRLLIGAFGSEAYGATVSITQFLGIIVLFEGGVGGVARSALYKHLAENDIDGISAVVSETQRVFRIVGYIFAVYVLLFACTFKFISNVECLDWISSFLLVIAISISTFGHYFVGLSNIVLLRAAQKLYVSDAVSAAATVINTLCVVALVYTGCNLITVKLASSCIFLLRPVLLHLYVNKRFDIKKVPNHKKVLQQKRNGMAHQVAHFISINAATIVLTCFAGLNAVAVYAVYNMVVSHMQNLICSCMAGVESLFGDMIAKKEGERLNRAFESSEILISVIATSLLAVTAVLIVPFVKLYTEGIDDVNYIAPLLSQLLVLSSFLFCLRTPYHYAIISAGHFAQTQVASIGEAVINVALAIFFVDRIGLAGVAVAALAGTAFRFVYYVIYLSKNILYRRTLVFVKRFAVNAFAFAAVFALGKRCVASIGADSLFCWIACAFGISALAFLIVMGINAVAYRGELRSAFKIILGKSE